MENKNKNPIYVSDVIMRLRNCGLIVEYGLIPKKLLISSNSELKDEIEELIEWLWSHLEEVEKWLKEEKLFYESIK